MAKEFLMPKLDMTMEEGQISSWSKKEGDKIERGELLLEVSAEKAVMEVESTLSGTLLKILVQKDEIAKVNQPICIVGAAGEDISALIAPVSATTVQAAPVVEKAAVLSVAVQALGDEYGKVKASPAARRASRETSVDLSEVNEPSGPNGRVLEADVLELFKSRSLAAASKATPVAKAIAVEKGIDISSVQKNGRVFKDDILNYILNMKPAEAKTVKLSPLQRAAAAHLAKSAQTVPHVTNTLEVDMSAVLSLCANLNERLGQSGIKVSATDVIIKAVTFALLINPLINARFVDNTAVYNGSVNIGLAVALDEGLIVPVIKNTDKSGLLEIIEKKGELVKKAKEHTLTSADMSEGSLTITNLGMFGVDIFTPIINIPEASILGVGQIKKRPVVVEDEIVIRSMMWMSYSYDHRLIDGVPASKFMKHVKEFLEKPELMFLR